MAVTSLNVKRSLISRKSCMGGNESKSAEWSFAVFYSKIINDIGKVMAGNFFCQWGIEDAGRSRCAFRFRKAFNFKVQSSGFNVSGWARGQSFGKGESIISLLFI